MTGTILSVEAQLTHTMALQMARATELRQLTREVLLHGLGHAYARRLQAELLQIATGELLHLVLKLKFPAAGV